MKVRKVLGLGLLVGFAGLFATSNANAQPPTVPLTITNVSMWVNASGGIDEDLQQDNDEERWANVVDSAPGATLNAQIEDQLVVGIVGAVVNGLNTTASAINQITSDGNHLVWAVTWAFGGSKATVGPRARVAHGSLLLTHIGDDNTYASASNEIRRNGQTVAMLSGDYGWYTQIVNGEEEQVWDASGTLQTSFFVSEGDEIETVNSIAVGGAITKGGSSGVAFTSEDVYVTE